jgi:STE24 endopeptidase
MNEDKATRYHRLGRRASVISTIWTVTLLLGLMISGSSVDLREWAEDTASLKFYLNEYQPLVVGLYVLALSIIIDIALLPITFYKGFVLERRYGLGTETAGQWLKDYAKALVIGLVFAEAGAEFVYYTIREWPEWWWAVSGFGSALVTVALVNLAPVLILPLFFKFKPLDKPALRDRLTSLAGKANTKVMGVYEWRLSDKTKKANAALAGMGNTRRIILSDTLLAEYSDDEIEVILAHELAHHVYRDIWNAVGVDAVLTLAGFYAANLALRTFAPYAGLKGITDPAGVPILLMSAGALALVVKPLLNAQSRRHERRADAYALRMTRNPSAFISAMRRLGQQNLAEDNPSRLVQAFFYTHPPIKERLRAAEER